MDSLKLEHMLTHMWNIFEFTKWQEEAESWDLSSNFSVGKPSVQKQFFQSIVNTLVVNAVEPQIKATVTFIEMLKLSRDYFNNTMSHLYSIQQQLNLWQDKEEPVSSWMEQLKE